MSVNVCAYVRNDVQSLLLSISFFPPQFNHVFASELFLRNINLFVLLWKLNETVCKFEELHLCL